MLTMDVPPEAPPAAQVVLIAQAPQANVPVGERVIGVCEAIDYRTPDGDDGSYWPEFNGGLGPQFAAQHYLVIYEKRSGIGYAPLDAVEVLSQPQHGIVKRGANGGGTAQYNYVPDLNYIGTDKVVFRVMTDAGPVVVQYYLVVTNKGSESETARRLCDKASKHPNSWKVWKISSTSTAPILSVIRIGN